MKQIIFTRHVAGEFANKMQSCTICGKVILDYRNAMWPADQPEPKGWRQGQIFISNTVNPQLIQLDIEDGDAVIDCDQ